MKDNQNKEKATRDTLGKRIANFDPDEVSEMDAVMLFGAAQLASWQNMNYISHMKVGKGTNPDITYSLAELRMLLKLTEEGKLR